MAAGITDPEPGACGVEVRIRACLQIRSGVFELSEHLKTGEFETFMDVISPWEREFMLLNVWSKSGLDHI